MVSVFFRGMGPGPLCLSVCCGLTGVMYDAGVGCFVTHVKEVVR